MEHSIILQKDGMFKKGPMFDAELFYHVLWVIELDSGPKLIELKEIYGIPSYKKQGIIISNEKILQKVVKSKK